MTLRFVVLLCGAAMMHNRCLQIITSCASSSGLNPKKVPHSGMSTLFQVEYCTSLLTSASFLLVYMRHYQQRAWLLWQRGVTAERRKREREMGEEIELYG